MPVSNSKPQQSPATDTPLGAPAGNEPYVTKRMGNMAQEDGQDVASAQDAHQTSRMGNEAFGNTGSEPAKQPTPAQGS